MRFLDAACEYRGFSHRRRLVWLVESEVLAIIDTVDHAAGGDGTHRVQQSWHCGGTVTMSSPGNYRIGAEALLALPSNAAVTTSHGWQSEVPGQKVARFVIAVETTTKLPATLAAVLFTAGQTESSLCVEERSDALVLRMAGYATIELPDRGDPVLH